MKNSLVKKITEGAKQVGKKVLDTGKRYALPIIASGIVSYATTQNANAQNKSDYKKIDKGAEFTQYKAMSDDVLEEKAIYNPAKNEDERFYIQHLDFKERKKYDEDLDIAAMPSEEAKAHPMMGLESSDADYILTDEMYHFLPVENMNKVVIEGTRVRNMCDNQAILIANGIDPTNMANAEVNKKAKELRGDNYIFTSSVKDYMESFTGNKILELGNGEKYVVLPLPEDQQVEGKTNFILMEMNDKNHWSYEKDEKNEKNLNIVMYGKSFRGNLEKEEDGTPASSVIDTKSGLVARLTKSDSTNNVDNAQKTIDESRKNKERKKGSLYLIFGANASPDFKFVEGQFGVQKGPIALVANYGLGKDERVKEITTATSPNTGRYGYGTEDNTNLKVLGLSAELHGFSNRKISPFIGGGINKWDYTTEISEQIKNTNGDVLKTIFNSKANSELSYKAIAGLNVKLGKNLKLGLQAGYDTKTKLNAGARCSLKF